MSKIPYLMQINRTIPTQRKKTNRHGKLKNKNTLFLTKAAYEVKSWSNRDKTFMSSTNICISPI